MVNGSGIIKTGAWDPEEDDLLYYWQSKVGNKWSEVAKHIPGRTGQQCAQRWRHKVNPNIRRDKWTAEEDAKLIELVKTFGVGRWAEIARNCDGRTDQQCMGRWRRHLDPSIKRDSWSAEEDAKLRQLHAQYGTSWSRISKCLKGRTSQQCRARWHQINHGRGGKSGAAAGSSSCGGKQATAGKHTQAGKRKQSRRRSDFSDSEDYEEEDEYGDEDEDGDYEPDYDRSSSPNLHSSDGAGEAAGCYYDPQAMAAAAATAAAAAAAVAAAGGTDLYSLGLPAAHPGVQLPEQAWTKVLAGQVQNAAAVVGHLQQNDVTCGTDQANEENAEEDEQGSEDVLLAGANAAASSSRRQMLVAGRTGGGSHSRLLPIKQERLGAGACQRDSGTSSAWNIKQQLPQPQWSPSRALTSPRQQARVEWQQLQHKSSSNLDCSELDEEETAGAETLLQMAHLLRRESCEFEPPSLRRSDFITASTPPKRLATDRFEVCATDELSPSPFKRARSSRGALFGRSGAADDQQDDSLAGLSRGAAAAIEAAAAEDRVASSKVGPHRASGTSATCSRQQQRGRDGLTERSDNPDHDDYMDAGVDADAEGEQPDSILGFVADNSFKADRPLPQLPARPSNASSLTACNPEAAAAAGTVAAAFLSPPPVPRAPCSTSRWRDTAGGMVTPRRPTAQQNLMNILGSPSFDRMAGYASPPSAGRTQPSAATLAALQSPQPSCVHEPFWTPFTGLFKDAMFTRGTSATPDLPSGGKVRGSSVGLFSPGRKSNSASKAMPRRSLLASPALERSQSCRAPDDSRAASQAAGSNTKPPVPVCPADSDTGPSPAAACGLQSQQVSHRVVRRLDQHEAWGTPLGAAVKAKGEGTSGIGFSLFSPVKKQRVPLFNESNAVNSGVNPNKPEPVDLQAGCSLTIAPLKHDFPSSCESLPDNLSSPATAAAPLSCSSPSSQPVSAMPHGRSPLGSNLGSRVPTMSWKRPPASQLLSAVPRHLLLEHSMQQAAQQREVQQQRLQQQQEQQQQDVAEDDGSPMAISPEAGITGDNADASARSQAAREQHQSTGQQRQNEGEPRQLGAEEEGAGITGSQTDAPDTPVHLKQGTTDDTSCSGTPNTPAEQCGQGQGSSPSDYVTPQQRMRLSRPLAPLHKDCLIAAATRSLTSQDLPRQAVPAPPTASTGAAVKGSAGDARSPPMADTIAPADVSTGQQSASMPTSADSSRHDGFMDSPLQPCQQLQSPTSQWHQGMVAMLHNLQQTPLQPGATGTEGTACAGANGKAAGELSHKTFEAGAIRPGSRALRRLQDELERGSTAATVTTAQVPSKATDVQVPFTSALVAPHASTATAVSSSAPLLLPLFNTAATNTSTAVQAQAAAATASAGQMVTPVSYGAPNSVASVSLAPAVISCSHSEVFPVPVPATTVAAAALMSPQGLPAVAWPVQQRPDGGLVVTAPPGSHAAADSVLQLTPPAAEIIHSRPVAAVVPSKDSAAMVSGSAAVSAADAHILRQLGVQQVAAAGSAVAGNGLLPTQWPSSSSRLTVVSIQPVATLASMMGTTAATPVAAGMAAMPPVYGLQKANSCSTAVAERKVVKAATGVQADRYDSSHAVRSRLHALIDGV